MAKPTKPTNHDPDHDPGKAANDNGNNGDAKPVVVTSKGSALGSVSLAALTATFQKVDTTPIGGRSALPLLLFKSRAGGIWTYGQRQTIPEPGSRWAANPASFMWGHVCWGDNKRLGEKLVPVSETLPDVTKLPDTGFAWNVEMAVNLKCISGTDAGAEVVFKTNTDGGKSELDQLINIVRDRVIGGLHDDNVSPIVLLERSNYTKDYGLTWVPVLTIVDWMPLNGPAPVAAPASSPPPSAPPAGEPTRRRRVG
jgi:hypothetical protein